MSRLVKGYWVQYGYKTSTYVCFVALHLSVLLLTIDAGSVLFHLNSVVSTFFEKLNSMSSI